MGGDDITAIDVMNWIVISRCSSFSFNGLTTVSHQMEWNGGDISVLSNERLEFVWYLFFISLSFLLSIKILACSVVRLVLFLSVVAVPFAVSSMWVPMPETGMAQLWLGALLALLWGISQQFWTHLSSLRINGGKKKEKKSHVHRKDNFSKLD